MATRWDGLTLEERFWEKVHKRGPDECWRWGAATNEHGYGVINRGDGRTIKAHRLSYALATGERLTPSQKILHRCDNPPCVNPAHLRVGTQIQNIADAVSKRRHKFGERGATKLAANDVKAIQSALDAGALQADVAEQFGISQSFVSMIKNGKRWAA